MSLWSKAIDYGTPIGWAGKAAQGVGLTDQSFGDAFEQSMNRGSAAEAGPYGGIDRNNYNLPGFAQGQSQYSQLAQGYGNRQAPQAGRSQYAGQQAAFGRQLGQEAQGNGLGQRLIQQQAQGQADRGFQQQLAMAASARPGQGASASRMAAMNAGNMNAQVGGQAAQAAGQYQLGAMNNYGQFLGQARGQDDQNAQFNVNARLQQLGLNDSSQLSALGQRLQQQQMQQQGGMSYEDNRARRYGAVMNTPTFGEQMYSGLKDLGSMAAKGG